MGTVGDNAGAGPGGLAAIVLDCRHAPPLARFWAEALGWAVRPYAAAEVARLASAARRSPTRPWRWTRRTVR
jgi:hypothetical protein